MSSPKDQNIYNMVIAIHVVAVNKYKKTTRGGSKRPFPLTCYAPCKLLEDQHPIVFIFQNSCDVIQIAPL